MYPRVIGLVHEATQVLLLGRLNHFHQLLWHIDLVPPHIVIQLVSSHHIDNLDELIIVVRALEEGVLLENHRCHCAA